MEDTKNKNADKYQFIGEQLVRLLKRPIASEAFRKFIYIDMAYDCIKYPHPDTHKVDFHSHETYKAALCAIGIVWNMILTCEQKGIDFEITEE